MHLTQTSYRSSEITPFTTRARCMYHNKRVPTTTKMTMNIVQTYSKTDRTLISQIVIQHKTMKTVRTLNIYLLEMKSKLIHLTQTSLLSSEITPFTTRARCNYHNTRVSTTTDIVQTYLKTAMALISQIVIQHKTVKTVRTLNIYLLEMKSKFQISTLIETTTILSPPMMVKRLSSQCGV